MKTIKFIYNKILFPIAVLIVIFGFVCDFFFTPSPPKEIWVSPYKYRLITHPKLIGPTDTTIEYRRIWPRENN
jgi:hypothetical protein